MSDILDRLDATAARAKEMRGGAAWFGIYVSSYRQIAAELRAARAVCEAASLDVQGCICPHECSCSYIAEQRLLAALHAYRAVRSASEQEGGAG